MTQTVTRKKGLPKPKQTRFWDGKHRCEVCGEVIPIPVPREKNRIICVSCFGDHPHQDPHPRSGGEGADLRYHGGQFNKGEW